MPGVGRAVEPQTVAAIFMYHHVSSHVDSGAYARALTVSPAEFDRQLEWLRSHGCAALTVDDIVQDVRASAVRGCEVALTFDDGYEDAATIVLPALERSGYVATFYVTTGYVGTAGHLSQGQIRALAAAGNQIGAHTVNHLDLTTLADGRLAGELSDSRATLEHWIGARVTSVAYPAGRLNARVRDAAVRAGYDAAVSTQPGTLTSTSAADAYELPRFRILRGQGIALFADVLGKAARGPSDRTAVARVARQRIEGNAPVLAERVAVALLSGMFPEPITKVRVLAVQPAAAAGIMLSGLKWHRRVAQREFLADVAAMSRRAFAAVPTLDEVDIWIVVPIAVMPQATVSGDLAVSASRTVFSAAVRRHAQRSKGSDPFGLGPIFIDPPWQRQMFETR